MLTENDVVSAVCDYLHETGWTIVSRHLTNERGPDIEARRDGHTLLVEAKGEGSSKPTSARYGQAFNRGQVRTHVSVAILTALKVIASGRAHSAIALPDNDHHRQVLGQAIGPLLGVGIIFFWVKAGFVQVEGDLTQVNAGGGGAPAG